MVAALPTGYSSFPCSAWECIPNTAKPQTLMFSASFQESPVGIPTGDRGRGNESQVEVA